jgi:hypothetical protein
LHTKEYHEKNDSSIVRIVVSKGDELIGAAALGVNPYCLLGEIKQVVTSPKHRGNGTCKLLTKELTEISEKLGLEKVYSEARTREPAMQKALLDNGYEPIAIEPGQFIVYHDKPVRENMVLMTKYLNGGEQKIDKQDDILPEIKEKLGI